LPSAGGGSRDSSGGVARGELGEAWGEPETSQAGSLRATLLNYLLTHDTVLGGGVVVLLVTLMQNKEVPEALLEEVNPQPFGREAATSKAELGQQSLGSKVGVLKCLQGWASPSSRGLWGGHDPCRLNVANERRTS
jgi:hypothetical protein